MSGGFLALRGGGEVLLGRFLWLRGAWCGCGCSGDIMFLLKSGHDCVQGDAAGKDGGSVMLHIGL